MALGGARLGRALLVPVAVLVLWEIVSRTGAVSAIIMPAPSRVVVRWWDYAASGEMLQDAAGSLYRVLGGFAIGAGLALPLGLLMGAKDWIHQLFDPLLQILRPIPPIAYIPLAILWFGLGNPPAFFLISLGAFFPVVMNTIGGVRTVDAIYVRAARNLGASGATLFWRVILPASTPHIM